MKKKLFSLMMMCLLAFTGAYAQDGWQVGNGTGSNSNFPINTYQDYSISQQIYTADEMGPAGSITSIAYYVTSGATQKRLLDVYMVPIEASEVTDWSGFPVTTADLVYSDSVEFVANQWNTITLTRPYAYDGVKNVAILVNDKTGAYNASLSFASYASETGQYQTVYNHSGNTFANPGSSPYNALDPDFIENGFYSRSSTKNQIIFGGLEGPAMVNNFPTNSYYKYSLTQQIYTAEEIGETGDITKIGFRNYGEAQTRNLDIYFVPVDDATATDWIAVDSSNLVFSGDVTFAQGAWTDIPIKRFLNYDGTKNLAVLVDDNSNIGKAGLNFLTMEEVVDGSALYYHSDDTARLNPDPTDLTGIAATPDSLRAAARFEFQPTGFVQIGDLVGGFSALPVSATSDYSFSQQIYTANEIGMEGKIVSIAYCGRPSLMNGLTRNISIYMKNTDKESYTTSSDVMVACADADLVFSGNVSFVAGDWATINLTRRFEYDGESNLMVTVVDNTGSRVNSYQYFYYHTAPQMAMYNYGSTAFDPTATTNVGMVSSYNYRNTIQLQFWYDGMDPELDPNLYMLDQVNDSTYAFADTLHLGDRPNGYWMRPIDAFSLWNHTGNAINVSRFDFTPEEGFFTAEAIDNELPFQMAIDDTIPMLFTTNITDTVAFADTTFTRQFVVIYDAARTAGVWPIVVHAYNAVEPDVYELARVVDTFPYYDTLSVADIPLYDNYRLPYDSVLVDGPDAVYELTLDKDVLLNAMVIQGANGKVALYTQDFYESEYGLAGPDMENYYRGIKIGTPDFVPTMPTTFTATPVIEALPVTAGTYYLVASSTDGRFIVEIDTMAMPCPQVAEIVSPADDADDIQIGSGIELKWKLDGYATEYCLLFGSTYYCEDTLVGWTSDLAESFVVPANYPLYHNTNYFWKVCQRNSSCGTGTDGEVWGFTTTFNAPTNLHATDTSIFEGDDVVMEWTAIEDRTFRSYNVYLNDEYIGSTTTTPNPTTYLTYTIADSLLTYNMNPGHKVEVTAYYDEGESPKSEPYYIKVSGYGKITGKVYEQDGTTGIKNARVYITGVNEFGEPVEMDTVTTSNNGRYTINRVPVSGDSISYQAFAEKEGYQSPVEPIEGNPRAVAYRGTTQANFILDEVFAPVPPCAVFAEFYPDPEVEDEYVKVTWTMNGGESVDIDFETNDFSQGTFDNTVSSYPWVLTTDNVHGGTYAMKSSNAGVASSTSAIEATVTLSYDGSVSFWALCQGEGTSSIWDHCIFKIDGVEKFNYGANVTGWNEYTYDLTAGTHTLRWEYTKDSSVNPTGDGMWVDDIHFGSAPGGREVAEDRSFKYYRIYRTSCYNDGPYNSENTVLLGNNDTPADLEFVDVNWKTVGPGVYKWGVSRVYEGNREDYPNGRESEISWTCECIDKDMYLNNVRVTVLLNSADSPEGTTVSFTNLNEVEEQNHPMGTITLDETGYYKFGADNPFRKGDYVVTVEHEGYISETDTVSIWSNKHLRYVLTEIIYGTRNAYVSRTGWAMWDDALTGGDVPGGGGGGSGELTVNDGTDYDSYIPVYGLYADVEQTTEFVIPAAELSAMTGSPINSMKFYVKGTAYNALAGPFQVYMAEVASTTMSTVSGPSAGTVVYTGTLDATGEEMTVNFTTPYNYNGGNLLVGVYTVGGGNYSSSSFFGVSQTENTAICQYMGSTGVQTRNVKFLPKTTFAYGSRAIASGDQNGNRVANAADNTRHLEGYKVMCTNSFGEPIFNENTPHKFCQVATDRLVEGQKYYFQVAAIYSTGMSPYCDPVEWEYESCENYADIPIEGETTLAGNVISWLGGTPGPGPGPGPQPTGDATIILTVGDVWGDGTGYQMLLDADATAYGNEIPTSGPYTLGNYDAFEYKIPENADCNTTTSNIVFNNSVTITVPAGTYDWCITNPEPYGNMWIAADNGNVGGRQNDYVFEAGMTYEFVPAMFGQNDGVNVTVTGGGKNLRSPLPAGECRENKNHVASAAAPVANGTLPGMSNGNFAPLQSGPFRGATGYANCVYSMTWPNAYVSFDVDAPGTATNVSTVNINRGGDYADGFFYGFNDAGVFYKLNYETGAVIEQHTTSGALTEMSYNYANNTMYGISNAVSGNSQLVTVDLANGNTTPIGTGLGVSIMAFAIDLNGNAYGISITDGNFYTIDLATGTATMVGSTGKAVNYVQCMNFDHNTETLYWFQISGATDCALYSVNTTNGACTLVMNTPGEVTSFAVPFEGTPGPGPGPQPTPEGVIGYMLFRDGEWLAELPVDVTSYLDAEGGAHDYTMRVIYGGEAVLPSNNYNYAMSCGSTIELGYDVVCAPGDPISGDYYYESDSDFGAIISWEPQPEPPTPPTPPTAEATIILTVGDVWGDGTGYQMLLDADATAYGNEIPTTGPYTLGNYDAFEYKIPVNADCNTYTSNIVFNNSIAITVPAGTYDWCITNPEPGGNMWIASDNGTAGGRKDNYVFEAGMTYEFVPAMFGQNDGVNVTITPTGTKSRAALVGYNIYRSTTNSNYELVGTAAADATEYRDNVAAGNYFYQVTAVYDNDCESAPAANADDASLNYVVVEVTSVDDNTNRVALYPNPTNGLVKIEANGMRHITVVNALGQVVFDNDITGDEYQINMAQFNAGVYVVRIATENGVSTQRVTVVR